MGWRTPDLLSPLSSAGVLLIFGAGAIATTRMTTLQIALLGLSHAMHCTGRAKVCGWSPIV